MEVFTLVSPRVEDATLMVKGSTVEYSCGRCDKPVLVSPTSMEAIGWGLVDRILCVRCAVDVLGGDVPPT